MHNAVFILFAYLFLIIGITLSDAQHGTTRSPPPGAITAGPARYNRNDMKYDYGKALGLSILFYDAQRAGKLPKNNPIAWRGDSVLYDYDDDGHDLTGGWFDAGDHIKFNFPESFATWVLNWGLLKFIDAYDMAGQTHMMCDMVKWPLEYYLKCWRPDQDILYAQVGDADLDHQRWASPETLNISRPAWQVNASCPGSDVAGDMASALASGSILFSGICNEEWFGGQMLAAARGIYEFGKKYRGTYSDCFSQGSRFYKSSGYKDELAASAMWLYKATGEEKYLTDAIGFASRVDISWSFDWDSKGPATNLMLYEETREEQYLNATKAFMAQNMPGGTVPYTPCGLMFRNNWGANRYAANTAFIALMAAENNINPEPYKAWALSQINYLLGDNNYNISYEIGFGNNYPTHYHHRASSCIAFILDCNYNSPDDNPNVLYGGLVGGPTSDDIYADIRSDYVHNEVAVDYNAGFQSALAALVHFGNMEALPASPPRKC